ncbi:disease resistance protein RPM1-like [Rhodamnia argentea]|uniref:Disease resistance protein RPM1-like n=1 Tax=Rhodamnia argentea TaxID=178133 RepID=A0A8B8N2P7_9MYRT|nr:disease resistance protein RPM1-like [Rhodamnia argentea]
MADGVVTFLLNKLSLAIEEEEYLLRGFREELKHIRDELESIRAFLRVADGMEERDPELKVWVKQVRDVAFDIEDALDEYAISLARPPERGVRSYLQRVTFPLKTLTARRRIAYRIFSIKARVLGVSERHQRYRYKSRVTEQHGSWSASRDDTWVDPRGNALLLEESELIGIEKPRNLLVGWLIGGDSKLEVASIVGMGGLGKTTLAKKVFDSAAVKNHFASHAWVAVSRSFDVEDLLRDMIEQLFEEMKLPVPHGVSTMNVDRLKAFINAVLRQRRYLIVLDDLWSSQAWEFIQFALPRNFYGSRIMVTTRVADVALCCCIESPDRVYYLQPLAPQDSWVLFCKRAFPGNSCPPHLEDISWQILAQCGGLPLAIVAISGVLATRGTSRVDEWESIRHNLSHELQGNDRLINLRKILSLGFSDLPYYLKSCLLYLSVFPENHIIGHNRLVRLWITEGFVEENEGETLEEVAERYLHELRSRSLIQVARVTTEGRINAYWVHDILREILLTKTKDQNFAKVSNPMTAKCSGDARRLAIHCSLANTQLSKINAVRLRSLLVFGVPDLPANSSLLLSLGNEFKLLEVLDLTDAPLDVFPNEIVRLYHLKHLSLRGKKINRIPSTIGNLQKLEILDLKNTFVSELPASIQRLRRLRHLLLYRYEVGLDLYYRKYGFRAGARIGGLVSLQKLCCIEADRENRVIMDIGSMKQLTKLNLRNLRREDRNALCSSIQNLSRLQVLSLCSVDPAEVIDIEQLTPPRSLQRLYLEGRLEKLPSWTSSLYSVARLYLRHSRLQNDPLESLEALPNLVELQLGDAYEGESLCFRRGGFPRLKLLWLIKLKNLKWVTMEEDTMPSLEKLTLRRCESLKEMPPDIERLSSLKVIVFDGMPGELFARQNPARDAKPSHLSKVFVNDGLWTRYV